MVNIILTNRRSLSFAQTRARLDEAYCAERQDFLLATCSQWYVKVHKIISACWHTELSHHFRFGVFCRAARRYSVWNSFDKNSVCLFEFDETFRWPLFRVSLFEIEMNQITGGTWRACYTKLMFCLVFVSHAKQWKIGAQAVTSIFSFRQQIGVKLGDRYGDMVRSIFHLHPAARTT